ncbi:MAG: Na/Pi cotransporter family protein [Clostridia bacterium]|nr:Na/Pi cotransporter family protein [Clostridia bacterium]
MENFLTALQMLGGAAMFLFGMRTMSAGLEKVAGEKMQRIIETLTSNVFKGVLVGAAVTALIQASGATTVMVVGFVNAGIMTLKQAVGVIMGANIGTTITAQILSLAGIEGNVWYLEILKPATLAYLFMAFGIFMVMSSKKGNGKASVGEIFLGLGTVFVGMSFMTASVSGLKDSPIMEQVFLGISNPIAGIIVGAIVTAVLQSSSASVGILQAFTVTGMVTYANAVPIILGQNIGTCFVTLVAAAGASKNAKRAACIHLFFNMIGVLLCFVLMYGVDLFMHFDFWDISMNMHNVAMFHTGFNVINTIVLLPFTSLLVKLANMAVHSREKHTEEDKNATALDDRFLKTPPIAVRQAMRETENMGNAAIESMDLAFRVLLNKERNLIDSVKEYEEKVDEYEARISQYLIKIVAQPLSNEENRMVTTMLHIVTDLERVGDHAVNICHTVKDMDKAGVELSDDALAELSVMSRAARETLMLALKGFSGASIVDAMRVQCCEDAVDDLRDVLKARHVERLVQQKCSVRSGVAFLDIINNLERVSDHASNIGISTGQLANIASNGDSHEYLRQLQSSYHEKYEELMLEYKDKYSISNI